MTSAVRKILINVLTHRSNFSNSLKSRLTNDWAEFFDSLREDHELFAFTVVFKPIDANNSQERWEQEYRQRVLERINRAICRRRGSLPSTELVFPHFFYFERNESSIFRNSGSRKPFHIHAVLPIRKSELHRIWSSDNSNLKERILKDIFSLGTVQSVLFEPIPVGKTVDWVRYTAKMKDI